MLLRTASSTGPLHWVRASRQRVSACVRPSNRASREAVLALARVFWVCSRAFSKRGAQCSALWPSISDCSRRRFAVSCCPPVQRSAARSHMFSAFRNSTDASDQRRSPRALRARSCRAAASLWEAAQSGPEPICSRRVVKIFSLSCRLRRARLWARPWHWSEACVHKDAASSYSRTSSGRSWRCDCAVAAFRSALPALSVSAEQESALLGAVCAYPVETPAHSIRLASRTKAGAMRRGGMQVMCG